MPDNQPLSLEQLTSALQSSWAADTCFDAGEWSESNPARGHCVASSLVVQDYFGGDLQRYRVRFTDDSHEEMHYCNKFDDGTLLDTTAQQYQWTVTLEPLLVDLKGFATIREKRLADADTKHRYELLAKHVAKALGLAPQTTSAAD